MDKKTQGGKAMSELKRDIEESEDFVLFYVNRSFDYKQVMLTIDSTRAISPLEYLEALQSFIDDIPPERINRLFEDHEEYVEECQ